MVLSVFITIESWGIWETAAVCLVLCTLAVFMAVFMYLSVMPVAGCLFQHSLGDAGLLDLCRGKMDGYINKWECEELKAEKICGPELWLQIVNDSMWNLMSSNKPLSSILQSSRPARPCWSCLSLMLPGNFYLLSLASNSHEQYPLNQHS